MFPLIAQENKSITFAEAHFSGTIKNKIAEDEKIKDFVITVTNPIIADRIDYTVKIEDNGSFSLRIPVVNENYGGIISPLYTGLIPLIPNEETALSIIYDKNEKKIDIRSKSNLNSFDLQQIMFIISDIIMNQRIGGDDYTISPDDYSKLVLQQINKIIMDVENRNDISVKAKNIITNEIKLFYLTNSLLDYKGVMNLIYMDKHNGNMPNDNNFNITEPDLQYYSFLKEFDLNKIENLSSSYYMFALKAILNMPLFDIPSIGEMDIDRWIDITKSKIGNLVGMDSDFFYEMLVSISYSSQLNEMKSLSMSQLRNIENHFSDKNKSIIDILFAENYNVLSLSQNNNKNKYTINEISTLREDQVIGNILSKYKNKIIVIDFWATWCGPCLAAIRKMENVKAEYQNKDVVFVYITTESSPKKVWERSLENIGGEHYYVDNNVWDYLYRKYDISAIPAYLLFDKQGNLVRKQISYMGNENMKLWINELLKSK